MNSASSQRFNSIASNYATSEAHISSPTLTRLHALLPRIESVCDVASGAGHTGLSFAKDVSRIVAVDPAPKMLAEFRKLAAGRGVASKRWKPLLNPSHYRQKLLIWLFAD